MRCGARAPPLVERMLPRLVSSPQHLFGPLRAQPELVRRRKVRRIQVATPPEHARPRALACAQPLPVFCRARISACTALCNAYQTCMLTLHSLVFNKFNRRDVTFFSAGSQRKRELKLCGLFKFATGHTNKRKFIYALVLVSRVPSFRVHSSRFTPLPPQ